MATMRHIWFLAVFGAAMITVSAAAAAPTTTSTTPKPPGQVAAVAQYEEVLPTAAGGHVTQGQKAAKAKLARSVQRRVRQSGGSDASTLLKVAGSTRYGAPSTNLTKAHPAKQAHVASKAATSKPQAKQAAAPVGATGSGSGTNGQLIALIAALVILSAAAGMAIVRRRRAG